MCPRPTHTLLSAHAGRAFVGRQAELAQFAQMLGAPAKLDEYQVLSLFGVGGQGKTTLLDRFARLAQGDGARQRPLIRLDFALPTHRSAIEGLFVVRNQLRMHGVPTHAFDTAFARHFADTRPGRDLRRDHPELYRFKEDSLFGELVDIGGEVVQEIPGGKLAVSILARLSNAAATWYYTRGIDILKQIDGMGPQELADELPYFLGYDVTEFLKNHPQRRPVLLIDTYEALWREQGSGGGIGNASGDRWLRRLTEESRGCLVVVAGRRRVAWDEVDPEWSRFITHVALGGLADGEAAELLDAAGLASPDLRSTLLAVAAGHPLSLKVGIRFCEMRMAAGQELRPEDLPRTHREILDRFFDHLDPPLRGVMRALAVPTSIRPALWSHLARSGLSGFDLYTPAEVLGEVFFQAGVDDSRTMHERVREHLLDEVSRRDPALLERVRLAVFDFHDRAAATDAAMRAGVSVPDLSGSVPSRDECLVEAAHQLALAAPERYVGWLARRLDDSLRGSRRRAELVERAERLVAERAAPDLADTALVARLRVSADPWADDVPSWVDRVAALAAGRTLPAEVAASLLPMVRHLRAARPHALPSALLDALMRSGAHDLGTALAAGDLAAAVAHVEKRAGERSAPDTSWDEVVAVTRAGRDDLVGTLARPFRNAAPDDRWHAQLARMVDALNLLDRPDFAWSALAAAMAIEDPRKAAEQLAARPDTVLDHQFALCVVETLLRCGHRSAALGLLRARFGAPVRKALVAGLDRLPPSAADPLASPEGKAWIDELERQHRVPGLLMGYVEALMDVDDDFVRGLSAANSATLQTASSRERRFFAGLGGRPTYSTLRKNRFDLVINDRHEPILFMHDVLLLWRETDWIRFDPDYGFSLGDARQGAGRSFRLLGVPASFAPDLGDGASLLVVVVDEQDAPVVGEYLTFFGRSW